MTTELHVTTFKMAPRIGGGLRMLAAINGKSVADLAEEAVRQILQAHGRETAPPAPKARTGRPGPTIQQAAQSVLKLKPTRNDTIPTRIEAKTAQELADLAKEIGKGLGDLAEEGATLLLKRANTDFVRHVAGLDGASSYKAAIAQVEKIAAGEQAEPSPVINRKATSAVPDNGTGTTHSSGNGGKAVRARTAKH